MKEINLLPPELIVNESFTLRSYLKCLIPALTIVLLLAVCFALGNVTKLYKQEIVATQAVLDGYAPVVKQAQEVRERLKVLEERIAGIDFLQAQCQVFSPYFDEIIAVKPANIVIMGFNPDQNGKFLIKGEACRISEVAAYLQALQNSELFQGMKLDYVKDQAQANKYEFQFSCYLRRGGSSG